MSNIDDIFKKGLDGSGMEYSDASWAGMEQMLNTKKVGFFARYKLLLGLGSVLLIGSVALYYSNNEGTTANTAAVVAENIAIKEKDADLENVNDLASNSTSSNRSDNTVETATEVQEQSTVTKNNVDAESKAEGANSIRSDTRKLGSKGINKIADAYKYPIDNSLRTDEPISSFGVSEQSGGESIERLASLGTGDNVVDFTLGKLPKEAISEGLNTPDFKSVITAERISISELPYSDDSNFPSELDFLPNLKKKKYSFYLSPYAGYVIYANNVKLPVNITDEETNLGKSTTASSYNYGLNIGVKRGKWILSSGIGYLSLRENTFYTQSTSEYQYISAPRIAKSDYSSTPRGTRVALVSMQNIDSTLIERDEQICEGCKVSLNYVSVPLNLQYNFGKSRLRYFAEGGVTASFLQNADGKYALPQEVQVDSLSATTTSIVSLANSEDVSKMLLQANAAVGVKFWLTPRWNLWSSYGYGVGLNSMLGSYEQKHTIQNVRVGVEFKLR